MVHEIHIQFPSLSKVLGLILLGGTLAFIE